MDDRPPTSESQTHRATLLGGASGAGVGAMLNVALWGLLGLLGLVLGACLFVCMGAANLMSVNNVPTEELIRDLPEAWWAFFGDFFTVLAMGVAGLGGVVFLGCLVVGAASGWTGTKLAEMYAEWRQGETPADSP